MSDQRIKYNVYLEGDPRQDQSNATCLPVSAHELELTFEYYGPIWNIICPEKGCISGATDLENGICWVIEWFEDLGVEMMHESKVSVRFSIIDLYKVISDGPVIQVKNVVGFKDKRYDSVGYSSWQEDEAGDDSQ